MASKNRIRIMYPSSEKIYVPGKIHKINVGMRKIKILDSVTRDENGELVYKKNNPVIVYDTSGPYSDPKIPVNTQNGIPRIRESWYAGRKDLIRLEELTSDYGGNAWLTPRWITSVSRNITCPIVPKQVKTSPSCIMQNGASSLRKWSMSPSAKTSRSRR